MASSVAVKCFLYSNNLFSKPLLRPVASTASRSFNTNVMIHNITPLDMPEWNPRQHYFPRSYGTACHLHDGIRRPIMDGINLVSVSNPDDALDARVDMAGLSKEDVKISFEPNILTTIKGDGAGVCRRLSLKISFELTTIKGEGDGVCHRCTVKISVEPDILSKYGEGAKEIDEEGVCRFVERIDLHKKELYKFDQIKAEMKNGELQVIVPKKWLL